MAIRGAGFQTEHHIPVTHLATILNPGIIGIEATTPEPYLSTGNILAGLGNHIDHTGKRISTIERRTRAPNHFNALHRFNGHTAPHVAFVTGGK